MLVLFGKLFPGVTRFCVFKVYNNMESGYVWDEVRPLIKYRSIIIALWVADIPAPDESVCLHHQFWVEWYARGMSTTDIVIVDIGLLVSWDCKHWLMWSIHRSLHPTRPHLYGIPAHIVRRETQFGLPHYSDVMMSVMASQMRLRWLLISLFKHR